MNVPSSAPVHKTAIIWLVTSDLDQHYHSIHKAQILQDMTHQVSIAFSRIKKTETAFYM